MRGANHSFSRKMLTREETRTRSFSIELLTLDPLDQPLALHLDIAVDVHSDMMAHRFQTHKQTSHSKPLDTLPRMFKMLASIRLHDPVVLMTRPHLDRFSGHIRREFYVFLIGTFDTLLAEAQSDVCVRWPNDHVHHLFD